jgi:cyclase
MFRPRIIPCLTLQGNGLVKTKKFRNPVYIGDPINTVRIFNEKCADELILLDIDASKNGSSINSNLIKKIAEEAFMPLAYGGGLRTIDDISLLFETGIEKVIINTSFYYNPDLISVAASRYGSQSIVVAADIRKNIFGKNIVFVKSGKTNTKMDPVTYVRDAIRFGAGEIFINSIDRDGLMEGYDIDMIRDISDSIDVPLIACGGAGTIKHLRDVFINGKASAAAGGSFFIFNGPYRAVLISYPGDNEIKELIQ